MSPEVENLLARLTEQHWMERRAVVTALARAGNDALDGLCDILWRQREDETRIASAVEALVASTGNADAVLLAMLEKEPPPAVLCDIAVVLGRRHSKRGVPALEQLTLHSDGNVALAAIEALGRIGGSAGLDGLLKIVASRDFFRTFPAIEVLGKSREPRAVAVLIELLDDPLYALPASRALGESADPRAVEALTDALLRGDEGLVNACAVALANIAALQRDRFIEPIQRLRDEDTRNQAADLVRKSWDRGDVQERAALAYLLGWIGGPTAIAALLDVVRADEHVTVATADALRSLGRQADAPVLEIIKGGTSAQRRALLPILGSAPTGVAPILDCLQDPDPEVRSAAADALGRIGNTSAVPALFKALADENAHVVQACVAAIQSLGSNETEALALVAAKSTDARVRRSAMRIISYFGYSTGAEQLIQAAQDPDERIRDAALAGLPFLDDGRGKAALLAAAAHASAQTRAVAMRALAQLTVDDAVQATLAQGLRDEDAWVRYYAALSTGRLRAFGLTDTVVKLLDDSAGQVRVAAIEALSHLRGDQAQAALEQAARSSEPDLQRAAIVGLGVLGSDGAVDVLLEHATSSDPAARLMALSSLANYEGASVVQALRRAAFDDEWSVRQAAVALLAARKDSGSGQALIDLLDQRPLLEVVSQALASHDKHIAMLSAALDTANQERALALANVLARIKRLDAERVLLEALKLPNVYARRAAASALSSMRSPEAVAALRSAATNDPDDEVRSRASIGT